MIDFINKSHGSIASQGFNINDPRHWLSVRDIISGISGMSRAIKTASIIFKELL